ncbi:FAD-dependent oxidoreductase [Mesorhizobium sp. B3-1-3]|uniref:NAD(P)/FAD-dependent oxidoreductase n=1 Tax=unclassified Mesorhizobium TaxID=325217 RepID=UPI00112CBEBB|nr:MULTISPECIES: FAD-dependent oxidoreductase [unclassified Mesorhizobium]TPI67151.1 FAD-dependent oxidoreductase [Mesorhizobium sp. B3-1-8]TPI70381.1 FAD-dependent oxidoreductase [Mesorhizobium sp. B3-1-3]
MSFSPWHFADLYSDAEAPPISAKLSDAVRHPFWDDTVPSRSACSPVTGDQRCDLAIVGGGFTGLWTALQARRRRPQDRIILVERARCGDGASGRNGGFCAPSISHGVGNALKRWPAEAEALVRLGRANLDEFEADLTEFGMEVEFERNGKLNVAQKPWQVEGLQSWASNYRRFGIDCQILTGDALREKFSSPLYPAGLYEPNYALINPRKMVSELLRVVRSNSVDVHEDTAVSAMREVQGGIELETPGGVIRAAQVVLATNAAPPLLRRLRRSIIPIFDYALVTRPLSEAELASIGWTGRHSVADCGNQFHYIRKTADNRILWGGYDAIYHFGSRRDDAFLKESQSFARLADNFAKALPSLAHVPFTHAWGGIIDTSARTTFFAGLSCGDRVAYAMGFTGQGVSASRFAALTTLDLLEKRDTKRTRLAMLRRAPFPFPPEPMRWLGIRWAQHGLAREDETGRRSLLNKALDKAGVGFDS